MIYIDRTANDLYFDLIKKSLDSNSKLEYFKKKLLDILSKKEKEENDGAKRIVKSRVASIGEIREWKGKKFKKMPDKTWVRVYDKRDRHSEISIARLKGKVRRATSVEELFDIVSKNIHRFQDENGRTLDIVTELKNEVDKKKTTINKPKNNTGNKPAVKNSKKPAPKKTVTKKKQETKKQETEKKDWETVFKPTQNGALQFYLFNNGKYQKKNLTSDLQNIYDKLTAGIPANLSRISFADLSDLKNNLLLRETNIANALWNLKENSFKELENYEELFENCQNAVEAIENTPRWKDFIEGFNKSSKEFKKKVDDFLTDNEESIEKTRSYDAYMDEYRKAFRDLQDYAEKLNRNQDTYDFDFGKFNAYDLKLLVDNINSEKYLKVNHLNFEDVTLETIAEQSFRTYDRMIDIIKKSKNWGKTYTVRNKGKYKNFDFNNLPDMCKTASMKETFKNLGEYLNSFEIKDNRIKTIVQNFGDVISQFKNNPFCVMLNAPEEHYFYNPIINLISIPTLEKNENHKAKTILHEFGHLIDSGFNITSDKDSSIFNIENEISYYPESKINKRSEKKVNELFKKISEVQNNFEAHPENLLDKKAVEAHNKELNALADKVHEAQTVSIGIYDMYDALSGGKFFDTYEVLVGHGSEYYSSSNNLKKEECFANYFQIKIEHPEDLDIIKEDKPELYNYLESCLDSLYSRFNERKRGK